MPGRDDDDRPKLSWRDIDKRRDQSRHVSSDQLRRNSTRAKRAASGYRQAIDSFFEGGKAPAHIRKQLEQIDGPDKSERPKLIQDIKKAVSTDAIQASVDAYLARYHELPTDFDVLVQTLLHPDEEIVCQALHLLADLAGRTVIKKKQLLVERLRRIETLAEEASTKAAAEVLRRQLK